MTLNRTLDDGFQVKDIVTDDVLYRTTTLLVAAVSMLGGAFLTARPKPVHGYAQTFITGEVKAPDEISLDGKEFAMVAATKPIVKLNGAVQEVVASEDGKCFLCTPKTSKVDGVLEITLS